MTHPELNQLTRAEELFDNGKLEQALVILNDENQFKGHNSQQRSYFKFLKGLILLYQNRTDQIIKFGEELFKEGQKWNDDLQSFDGLFFIISGLGISYRFEEALNVIKKAEVSLRNISSRSKKILTHREIRLNVLKGWINMYSGNIEFAEKSLERALGSHKELGDTFEISWAHIMMAQIMLRVKSKYDLAMDHTKKALAVAKEIKFNHYWIAFCQLGLGAIYASIGEVNLSLKYYQKSLKLFREINNKWFIAVVLNNVGLLYAGIGDYNIALKSLEEALILRERDPVQIEGVIDSIINVALIKGDVELAKKHFHRLENMYKQAPNSHLELLYNYNSALMLKRSSRIRDKAKAEKLFKQVIGTKTLSFDLIINAHIHLCDLLLIEFRINNNSEVLDEINDYIAKLSSIAEKSHSYLIFCETFILQAKLALLTFNIKAARRFLTQAQKIAESYGIKWLAMKISIEHDNLLKELNKWEILSESNANLTERIELARLDDQMTIMLKKRSREVPEVSKEDPVMILILTEGGNLLFSKKFKEDFSFEDDILGGFLTTINYFISEVFSEGLDRAVFGQYTLLMMQLQPFLLCYIFTGHSYFAYNKIKNFLDFIRNDNVIWQSLQNFFQKSKSIQIDDIPSLESLITEIFVDKNN